MLIGYARTSTLDQSAGFEAQLRDLKAAGCEKIFQEQVSSVDTGRRDRLAAALDYIRDGDALVVTKLDRLARSVAHLVEINKAVEDKGAALNILDMNLDTSTSTGRLMLNVIASIAQFEREIMLERQREGIEKARQAGKYKGRKPYSAEMRTEIRRRTAAGERPAAIAREYGISRSTVYTILGET